ncbi:DNA-binding response regulator [Chryseobacterium carnipullorum]|uniref:response regulator n=1 Tax=Chryseobacterium carnipullorum TaxID=1124835 RepID=UPI000F5156E4|nr:response regulator transcription factor [Chryseobacterium carnipullorum]AZA66675.1 DNA-binding response regulator [Chryseobacterium carnipullorum]
MIKIFAYDDSQECLNSMRILIELSENMKYIGEALNCEHVEAEMEAYQPDVVLMDINMPVVDGIAGLKIIKSKFPQINVLVQTAFDDSEKVFRSISSGASGYILKSDNPRRILQAIEEIYEGGAFMNPAIAKRVLEYFQPTAEQKLFQDRWFGHYSKIETFLFSRKNRFFCGRKLLGRPECKKRHNDL